MQMIKKFTDMEKKRPQLSQGRRLKKKNSKRNNLRWY